MAKKNKTAWLQVAFFDRLKREGLPLPEVEYKFLPEVKRKHWKGPRCSPWKLDYAWPDIKVAIEVQGGIWRREGGAHTSGPNRLRDIEKHNALTIEGWLLLETTTESAITADSDDWKGADLHLCGDYVFDALKGFFEKRYMKP